MQHAFSDVGGRVVLGTPKSHQSRTVPVPTEGTPARGALNSPVGRVRGNPAGAAWGRYEATLPLGSHGASTNRQNESLPTGQSFPCLYQSVTAGLPTLEMVVPRLGS